MTRIDSIETARIAAAALRAIAPTVDDALFEIVGYASGLAATAATLRKRAEGKFVRPHEADNYLAKAAKLDAESAEIDATAETLREIARAGAWARFYFVPGGHVHRAHCSTLRPTTERLMLTEYAAATDEEIVAAAGSRACTVCFSDAPIDPRRASIIRYAVEEDEARAAEAAEKAAKAKAAADSAIRNEDGSVAFKSRRAAENVLSREIDTLVYFSTYCPILTDGRTEWPNPQTIEEYLGEREERLLVPARRSVREVIDLLKANGIPAEEVEAIAAKKLAAKVKQYTKGGQAILADDFSL